MNDTNDTNDTNETNPTESYEDEERAAIQGEAKPKKRRQRAKRKEAGPSLVGWYLEAYPLKEGEDGKTAPSYPPTVFSLSKSKNLKQAMAQFESVAKATPERIANCYCRIVQVHKDFRAIARQTIDIV